MKPLNEPRNRALVSSRLSLPMHSEERVLKVVVRDLYRFSLWGFVTVNHTVNTVFPTLAVNTV